MSDREPLSPRVRQLNPSVDTGNGLYVAYWMVASRRTFWNPALERATWWARELGQSLLVCEPLRLRADGGGLRTHRFLLDGMVSNARRLAYAGVPFHAFVQSHQHSATGLLEAVARRASVWITDFHPSTDLGDLSHLGGGAQLPIRAEAVDGESIASGQLDARGDIETFQQQFRSGLLECLQMFPARNPLAKFFQTQLQSVLPHIKDPWPAADGLLLSGDPAALARLGLSGPQPFPESRGGSDAAFEAWRHLIGSLSGADSDGTPRTRSGKSAQLGAQPEGALPGADPPSVSDRLLEGVPEQPAALNGQDLDAKLRDAADRPDPYSLLGYHLAAGHLSSYQVLAECLRHCRWTPAKLDPSGATAREWWGLPAEIADLVETFVVRRDLELARLRSDSLDRVLRRGE